MNTVTLAAVLVVVSVPLLRREADRRRDVRLYWVLTFGLLFKLLATIGREYVEFGLYGGAADVTLYHQWGLEWATKFRAGDLSLGGELPTGPYFIGLLTGLIYSVIGPHRLGAALIFGWLGFWGLFCFYRAFIWTFPSGGRRYAALLFFLPSLAFWTGGIGKDAWMMLALGVFALGAAQLLWGRWRGVASVAAGLLGCGVVRPQVAAMGAMALAVALVLGRIRSRERPLAPLAKAVSVATAGVVVWVATGAAIQYLHSSGFQTEKGIAATLEEASKRGQYGGSEFKPIIITSPFHAVPAAATVLYRPFPFEARNLQGMAAAFEATLLLCLTVARRRRIVSGLRRMRRVPYVAFASAFSMLAVFGLSSIANFGLLVRQRVQLLPFLLALICVPPWRSRAMAGQPAVVPRLARTARGGGATPVLDPAGR